MGTSASRSRLFWPIFGSLPLLLSLVASLVWDPFLDFPPATVPFHARAMQILKARTAPVRISWYHSGELDTGAFPSGPIWRDLRSLESGSSLPIRIVRKDPGRDPQTLAELGRLGARTLEYQATGGDGSVSSLYSALLVEYGDAQRFIPWVDSRERLSMDLSRTLDSLVAGRQDLVSLMAPEDLLEDVERLLGENGRAVRVLSPGQAVPTTSDSLIVLGPVDAFTPSSVQRIDAWIAGGGSCLLALDRVAVDLNAGSAVRDSLLLENPAMDALLSRLGLVLEAFLLHDERSLMIASHKADGFGGSTPFLQAYPWWPSVPASADTMNSDAPFAHPGLDLFWASPLHFEKTDGWKGRVLLASSDRSTLPVLPWYLHPAELSLTECGSTMGPQGLAICLEREDRGPTASLAGAGRVIVIGDSQFAGPLAARPDGRSSRNHVFLMDCLDWLEGRDGLSGIRSPLHHQYELEMAMPLSARARLLLLLPLFLPLLFLLVRRVYPFLRSSR